MLSTRGKTRISVQYPELQSIPQFPHLRKMTSLLSSYGAYSRKVEEVMLQFPANIIGETCPW